MPHWTDEELRTMEDEHMDWINELSEEAFERRLKELYQNKAKERG